MVKKDAASDINKGEVAWPLGGFNGVELASKIWDRALRRVPKIQIQLDQRLLHLRAGSCCLYAALLILAPVWTMDGKHA